MQSKSLKLAVALIPLLGVLMIGSNVSPSYAYDDPVKVAAKEKLGKIILLIKNVDAKDIHGIKLSLNNGQLLSATNAGSWNIKNSGTDTVYLSTNSVPIKHGMRTLITIGATNVNTIISWSAIDRFGSVIDEGDTQTVVRFKLDRTFAGRDSTVLFSPVTPEVRTDRVTYNSSDKIFISGALDPNTKITITILSPDGQEMKITDRTDVKGNFDALHVLYNAESGTYLLKASHPYSYVETSFRVL